MRDQVGFEASYKRHLPTEQRRAVLEALRKDIDPETSLGEIVDAAQALGWGRDLGELSLSELADVLLEAAEAEPAPTQSKASKAPVRDDHASARTRPRGSRPRGNRPQGASKRTTVQVDGSEDPHELDGERMSLDRAIRVFVPMVEELDRATMQDLEQRTGIGRRKLRFHIGQLVKSGHLQRHGMGRGTYYTVA